MIKFWITAIIVTVAFLSVNGQPDSAVNQLDEEGKKHGRWIKKDAKGHTVYSGRFEHGVPVDTFRYYTPKEKLKALAIHSENSERVRMINYHANGNIQASGIYISKEKDSVWSFYRTNGSLVSKENFSKGQLNDTARYYYYSGDLLKKTNFENGVRHGEETLYYENGQVNKIVHYDHGKLHGSYIVFFPDGDTMSVGQYAHDLKTGSWKYFDEEGNLVNEEEFE